MLNSKKDIFIQLEKEILQLQGFKLRTGDSADINLEPITGAFPNHRFPTGAVHEFISTGAESAAATGGFVSGLIASLMSYGGVCVWITSTRRLFAPGLKTFGIEADHVIFVDVKDEKEALWVTEQTLKCEGLAAVVGEIREIDLTASRRFQLAVEQSRVTGFLLRNDPRNLNTIASVARWKITSLPSNLKDNMPGIGFQRWNVELAKIRNGQPGTWQMEWSAGRFHPIVPESMTLPQEGRRKTG